MTPDRLSPWHSRSVLVSGVRNPVLSGAANRFLSENYDGSSSVTYDAGNLSTYKYIKVTSAPHAHEIGGGATVAFTTWPPSGVPTTAGKYYLTGDVTLDSTWAPVNGTALCLNGYSLKANGNFPTITVDSG